MGSDDARTSRSSGTATCSRATDNDDPSGEMIGAGPHAWIRAVQLGAERAKGQRHSESQARGALPICVMCSIACGSESDEASQAVAMLT